MEGLILLAGLVILLSLLVLPILTLIALRRGSRSQNELEQLKKAIVDLQQQIAGFSVKTPKEVVPVIVGASALLLKDAPQPVDVEGPEPLSCDLIPQPDVVRAKSSLTVVEVSPWDSVKDAQQNESWSLLSGLLSWFMQGNPLAKLGILLLFFGLAYLLKYTVERDMLPIEFRLIGAVVISSVLLWVGWRLRNKQQLYALILQGGSIGALYITVFGAFRLYQLVPHLLAFGLLLVICAASVGLAVLQRALSLAMLASIGGYLSPILLSTGSGDYIGLFSYYLLLSIGILAISIWQPWRPLNLLGFLFTFGVVGLWGIGNYQQEFYLNCQLFLIAYLLIFGVLSIAFTLRSQRAGEKIIDGVLLFGSPLVGFGMQYAVTQQWKFGPAFSALGFGFSYLLLAWIALKRYPTLGKHIAMSGLALGGTFTTLAIPLALSAQWTSMAWALEGLGVLWLGHLQIQKRMSYSGSALLVLALGSAAMAVTDDMSAISFILVFAVLALSWLIAAQIWRSLAVNERLCQTISRTFLAGSILLWVVCLAGGAVRLILPYDKTVFLILATVTLSIVLWRWLGVRLAWIELRYAVWLLWPCMLCVVLFQIGTGGTLLHAGWLNLVWLPVLATAYSLLKLESVTLSLLMLKRVLHLSLFWLVLLVVGSEIYRLVSQLPWGMDEWCLAIYMIFISSVFLSVHWAIRGNIWPFAPQPQLYGTVGLLPLVPLAILLLLVANTYDGVIVGWYYLPLFNPLEESACLTLLALIAWGRVIRQEYHTCFTWLSWVVPVFTVVMLFWWGNGIVLRVLAYYAELDWKFDILWYSRLIQTTFALLWMFTALIVMLWSTRHLSREGWFCGAVLLGIIIFKLFLVDSTRGGGLARAIAFIGVAVLVLIVGYFSPLPPKTRHDRASQIASERGK